MKFLAITLKIFLLLGCTSTDVLATARQNTSLPKKPAKSDQTATEFKFEILRETNLYRLEAKDQITEKTVGFITFEIAGYYNWGQNHQELLLKRGYVENLHVEEKARFLGIGGYLFSEAMRFINSSEAEITEWLALSSDLSAPPESQQKLQTFYMNLGGLLRPEQPQCGAAFFFDHANPQCNEKLRIAKPEGCEINFVNVANYFKAQVASQLTPTKRQILCSIEYKQDNHPGKFELKKMYLADHQSKDLINQIYHLVADKLNLAIEVVRRNARIVPPRDNNLR